MREHEFKAHATDDVVPVDRTLCGEHIGERSCLRIDNAMPNCKRCLRVIAARTRDA
jgi:hypothetical protein